MYRHSPLLTPENNLQVGTYICTGVEGATLLVKYLDSHPEVTIAHLFLSDSPLEESEAGHQDLSSPNERGEDYYHWSQHHKVRRHPLTDEEEDELEDIRHQKAKTHLRLKRAVRDIAAPLNRILDRAAPVLETLAFLTYIVLPEAIKVSSESDSSITVLTGRSYPCLKQLTYLNQRIHSVEVLLKDATRFPVLTHLHVSGNTSPLAVLVQRFPRLKHVLLAGNISLNTLPAEFNPVVPAPSWIKRLFNFCTSHQEPPLKIPANLIVLVQPGFDPMLTQEGISEGDAGMQYDQIYTRLRHERVQLKFPREEDYRTGNGVFPLRRAISDFLICARGGEGQWVDPGPLAPREDWWWIYLRTNQDHHATQRAQIHVVLRSHSEPPAHFTWAIPGLSRELVRYKSNIPRLWAELAKAERDYADLANHYDLLCNLLSPIRRLSSEILAQIFEECGRPAEDPNSPEPPPETDTWETHIQRLARKPLLTVSQFWDTIQLHSPQLWGTQRHLNTSLEVLRAILERGGNIPLTFDLSITSPKAVSALVLLGHHCARWKTARLLCPSSDLRQLDSIKGNLPLLETLHLEIFSCDDDDASHLMELFSDAPRLKVFVVGRQFPPAAAAMHFERLRTFGCLGQMVGQEHFHAAECTKAITDVFGCLALPRLRELRFESREAPFCLISWAHQAFMDLAERSSFHDHLHSLSLRHVVIAEADLLEVLIVLRSLKHLEVSDHRKIHPDGADRVLITDSLFSALTLNPTTHTLCVVPALHSLVCHSLLQFNDHAYLRFLVWRRREKPSDAGPLFSSRMCWWPGCRWELDADVVVQLRELCIRKELVCEFTRSGIWR
ncbi:hypothetical protein B0H19DRAFT_1061794 [Mycena capillaripes]|nr:hypothetical protein B0H19DRAFT_1061794 [Mycena capillaripes]